MVRLRADSLDVASRERCYDDLASKAVEIRRMLAGLIKRVTATIESKGDPAPRVHPSVPAAAQKRPRARVPETEAGLRPEHS